LSKPAEAILGRGVSLGKKRVGIQNTENQTFLKNRGKKSALKSPESEKRGGYCGVSLAERSTTATT